MSCLRKAGVTIGAIVFRSHIVDTWQTYIPKVSCFLYDFAHRRVIAQRWEVSRRSIGILVGPCNPIIFIMMHSPRRLLTSQRDRGDCSRAVWPISVHQHKDEWRDFSPSRKRRINHIMQPVVFGAARGQRSTARHMKSSLRRHDTSNRPG